MSPTPPVTPPVSAFTLAGTQEVILTHEHTDFDALASLLAAALLFPHALPVLPRQLNRNAANFLALYHNQLPFISDKDLPRGQVTRAIIVDARAANWVKGMDNSTQQYIIDHHQSNTPPAPHQRIWHEPVGANVTMLIEKLIDSGMVLAPIQATLLALGIHEDTGSLTYAATTHRDAYCLAWLMEPERGVNLEVLNRFLSHPMSDAQRALLQLLIDQSETVEIAGHTIVIAQADAQAFREELSALASRLRDFYETTAIFIVVDLGDMIQVVARSSTDEINVGKIATELGGGGHVRAAAAPVHDRAGGTAAIRDRIVALLQQFSRAAISVQQIMSVGRPQSLAPEMSVSDAAVLMRRYGHEGFPVLRPTDEGGEELLGVLTRREADRALNHDLGQQPVSRFMRAGNVTVRPQTPVNELRHLMIESGWGQIPVVDDNGKIMGIVTRTDLIKLWDESALPRHHANATAERLQSSLTPAQHALLVLIGEEVNVLAYTVYIVGGFVRDLLLNSPTLDVAALDMDIVIEGNAIAFAQRMQKLYGGRVVPHKRFNTAKWILNDPEHPVNTHRLLADLEVEDVTSDLPAHLDFVSARTEFYTAPTVLPTVEDSSIKLDLHRRDFTINTLALCLNPDRWGELLDFYGGLNDLNQGIVRVLHSLSFVDDPTRILRAVRYEQRFGFSIEPRTLELLTNAVELLDRVTPARIRHELERILQEEQPEKAMARLFELGVLRRLDPALTVDGWVMQQFAALRAAMQDAPAPSPLRDESVERLYWGILVYRLAPSSHAALTTRLGLRAETQRLMRGLAHLHRHAQELADADLRPSQIVAILDPLDEVALALAALLLADEPIAAQHLQRYVTEWRYIQPLLDGHALAALHVPRGPLYRELLAALRAARLDGQVVTRADEERFVQAHLAA